MFCPVCGKQQVSNQTRFCSGCGFPLTGVAEVIANGGASAKFSEQGQKKKDSPRKRGIKQGVMILLIGCLLILPVVAVMMPFLRLPVFLVPISAIISFMGGVLRIIYAYMFESNETDFEQDARFYTNNSALSGQKTANPQALPPQTAYPVSDFQMPNMGSWRDSAELTPTSVTENTTKLLDSDKNSL